MRGVPGGDARDPGSEPTLLELIGLGVIGPASSGKSPSGCRVVTARSVIWPSPGKMMNGVVMQVMATPPVFNSAISGGARVGFKGSGPTLAHPYGSPLGL